MNPEKISKMHTKVFTYLEDFCSENLHKFFENIKNLVKIYGVDNLKK